MLRILRAVRFLGSLSKPQLETQVIEKLKANFGQESQVELEDISKPGCGFEYLVKIQSKLFEGKTKVQQHKLVYGVLKEELRDHIHALRISSSSK